MIDIPGEIANRLGLRKPCVDSTIALLDEGATVPFISRYRKESTGSLNEVEVRDIEILYNQFQTLEKRKQYILETIEKQGALSPELKDKIENTTEFAILEDLYLPYKPKKRTRATAAREKGLESLAQIIMAQNAANVEAQAKRFVKDQVKDVDDAINGACDIIAEWVSENARVRSWLRNKMLKRAVISSKLSRTSDAAKHYRNYDGFRKPINYCQSHQYLALKRGEREGALKLSVEINEEESLKFLNDFFIKRNGSEACAEPIKKAIKDSYKRLLLPSIENEVSAQWKEKADAEAIKLFADSLHQLLMASPLGKKRVMGIDPGFTSGCKVVCLDEQGFLLRNDVIYPQRERSTSALKISKLVDEYAIDAIALGNGTASRETESFLRVVHFPREVKIYVVSESGASIYSASDIAREEFPDHDLTVRGAVSIGRRLLDPLAELVKIDPKSIGVGQYQHDVDQSALKDSLDYTVMSCVNQVGVNVNTASKQLLSYISGIGPALASNIVEYRNANGPFVTRKQLMKVPRLGERAFQLSAGFFRIPESKEVLDSTAVHPETYHIVAEMAKDLSVDVTKLLCNKELIDKIALDKYISDAVGLPTLQDIVDELKRPGRDPRLDTETVEFDPAISDIEDVKPGMELQGIVTNITAFGAFVDIGVHENGLVHISQMSDKKVTNPGSVVKINQPVRVVVLDVDLDRKRISLTMKGVKQ